MYFSVAAPAARFQIHRIRADAYNSDILYERRVHNHAFKVYANLGSANLVPCLYSPGENRSCTH